jgi:hypothetical protein
MMSLTLNSLLAQAIFVYDAKYGQATLKKMGSRHDLGL